MAFDQTLQDLLDELWFRLPGGTPADQKEIRQSWLVREFQIYAHGAMGATETGAANGPIDAEHLCQMPLDVNAKTRLPDGIFPSGVVGAETKAALTAWKKARLRSPVIFQAFTRKRGQWSELFDQGFIFHDEHKEAKPRIFARDYTGRQPLDANGTATKVTVGSFYTYHSAGGIGAKSIHSVDGAITPERLTGFSFAGMPPDQRSTFRVVVGLAQVESDGIYDGINAYDTSVLSAGPFHYTAVPAPFPVEPAKSKDAELGAILAYFQATEKATFDRLFGQYGVGPLSAWSDKLRGSDGAFRSELGFIDENGAYILPGQRRKMFDWLRNWHSFYRIQFALRTSEKLQRRIWPYARQRLADLLATPWTIGAPPKAKTLGDVFKSELTVALLSRWHVFRPSHVVANKVAGSLPGALVKEAGLDTIDVTTWTPENELHLAAAFKTLAKSSFNPKVTREFPDTLAALQKWSRPEWAEGAVPTLSNKRTFRLYADGIPFPPGAPPPTMEAEVAAGLAGDDA